MCGDVRIRLTPGMPPIELAHSRALVQNGSGSRHGCERRDSRPEDTHRQVRTGSREATESRRHKAMCQVSHFEKGLRSVLVL